MDLELICARCRNLILKADAPCAESPSSVCFPNGFLCPGCKSLAVSDFNAGNTRTRKYRDSGGDKVDCEQCGTALVRAPRSVAVSRVWQRDTDDVPHTCGPGIGYGCERPDCDGDVGD